ncbi:MAG: 50S ribosomal protein L4 [Candidatus Cloacimonadota bacterium]|nr:MAG: 50S ribosomal protein L4 [Candidatus Cloacimonadota bacterium]
MIEVTKYDKSGKESGKAELSSDIFDITPNYQAIKEYLILQMSNRRKANPLTKSRNQSRGGGAKPWRQKGTGRARAGSCRSPLWVGGAVAHGPDGRNYKKSMPKKVRRLAMRSMLTDKARGGALTVIEDLDFSSPKTKTALDIIKNIGSEKTLFIQGDRIENLELSMRNISNCKVLLYKNINPHDIINYSKVVLLEGAVAKIEEMVK